MQRLRATQPILTNALLSGVHMLGHSPLVHLWAGSSVTLTEELLKPKWLVRAFCRTGGQVTFLYNAPPSLQ